MFNRIAESFPHFEFTWIGDGDLRDKLISPNIAITGWKTREEVLEILNEQDVFILCSLWEGLPISLLEAMYLKKICITSDSIGNKDVIIDGKNGFIATEIEDYKNILESIKDLDVIEIKEKAQNDIVNRFDFRNVTKKYINIYK